MAMFGLLAPDLAIDLGTANTIIHARGEGIVLNEPSVIAVSEQGEGFRVIAAGLSAKRMLGRTPEGIKVVRPVRAGAIAQYEYARAMLSIFLKQALGRRWSLVKPKMIIGVPPGLTDVEKRAIREAGISIGAREVSLIDEAMAAALGFGLPIAEPVGSLIVDVGGGTTDIAAISLKGIILGNSLRVAGDLMDEAIIQYMRREYQLLIGLQTAELVKLTLGSTDEMGDSQEMVIQGQNIGDGCPRSRTISGREVRLAIEAIIEEILKSIRAVLELLPPEIAADILDSGINVTGGGSLLRGFRQTLETEFEVPVVTAEDPLGSVALGAAKCMNTPQLRELLF